MTQLSPGPQTWARSALLALPVVLLYLLAAVMLSASHFAAWDVMEEVPSTTSLATWLRESFSALVLIIAATTLLAAVLTVRGTAASRTNLFGSLILFGFLELICVLATSSLADGQIYPLTRASVDIVPTHSMILLGGLLAFPAALAVLAVAGPRRWSGQLDLR